MYQPRRAYSGDRPKQQSSSAHKNHSDSGEAAGLKTIRFETMSQFLLRLGESDQFAELVEGGGELALKTLIYGMGESFRVLLQRK